MGDIRLNGIEILNALRSEGRLNTWTRVNDSLPNIPEARPLKRLLGQYIRNIVTYEAFCKRRGLLGATRTTIRQRAYGDRRCRGCGLRTSLHRDNSIRRYHLWVLEQRNRVRKSWRNTPDRARRTLPARIARRRNYLLRRFSVADSRSAQLFGLESALRSLERSLYPVNKRLLG